MTQVALSQNETYELPEPGPVPDRQDAPHLHDAVLDPTGRFIIVPDLGADTLHVYSIVPGTIKWVELEPVKAVPGNGPRHGVFAVTGDHSTFFYVANELSNTITGYKVEYEDEDGEETAAPVFTQLFDISTHGEGGHVPNGTKAAELEISVSVGLFMSICSSMHTKMSCFCTSKKEEKKVEEKEAEKNGEGGFDISGDLTQ